MQTSNEKVFSKNRVIIGLPQKGQKQVYDLQHNALIALIHFVQLYDRQRNAITSLVHFAVQLHKVD